MTYVNGFGDCAQDWKDFDAAQAAYPSLLKQWQDASAAYKTALTVYNQAKGVCDSQFADWNTKMAAYQAAYKAYTDATRFYQAAVDAANGQYAQAKAKYDKDLAAYNQCVANWQSYNGQVQGIDMNRAQSWAAWLNKYPAYKNYDFSAYSVDCGQGVKFSPAVTQIQHNNYASQCSQSQVIKGLGALASPAGMPCYLQNLPVVSCPNRPSDCSTVKPVPPPPASSSYPPAVPPFTAPDPTGQKPVCKVSPVSVKDPGAQPTSPVQPSCARPADVTPIVATVTDDATSKKAGLGNIWIWVAIAGGAGYMAYRKWGRG